MAEVLISSAIAGGVMAVLATLMGKGAEFSSYFHNNAGTVEVVSEAVSNLYSLMPQVVRVRNCGCRGTNSTTLANCKWYTPDHPSFTKVYYDPVLDGSATATNTIFDADIESFHGSTSTMAGLLTSGLGSYATSSGGCLSYVAGTRGCKQRLQLKYTAPVAASGATAALAGKLSIFLGTSATAAIQIGDNTRRGQGGTGVVELSCGFVEGASQSLTGMNFALNIKLKSKSNTIEDTSSSNYESWHRAGANYARGNFREINMKFSFPNITNRGFYSWKMFSTKACLLNSVASSVKEKCCSQALNTAGNACASACKASGVAETNANACCSEALSAGNCK